jgi:hypothetical protein
VRLDELTFDSKGPACPVCTHPGGECNDHTRCPYWSREAQDWYEGRH